MTKPQPGTYFPPAPHFYSGRGDIDATRANLPHWNKAGTACFVTFRLADSLPAEKLVVLEDSRREWIGLHPQPWDEKTVREYFAQFDQRIQTWLDQGYGSCVLQDKSNCQIVEETLWHFAGERYHIYAYVVMANHVHVLFMPAGENSVSRIVAGWKQFTAHRINERLGRENHLWQKESFDTLVRNERHFQTIVQYIKRNDCERAWWWDKDVQFPLSA